LVRGALGRAVDLAWLLGFVSFCDRGSALGCRRVGPAGLGAGFGLERVEGLLGAQELGHGGVAVAHHGLDAPGAVAIADQSEAETAAVVQAPEVE
jgi:hypothetical protein